MANITINGTFRLNNTVKTPGFVYCYPMSSFYIGDAAITQSSPTLGENPYKVAAVTGEAGSGANAGTTVWTFSMILPSTVDADVNPVGARFGLYVFSDDDEPRLITEISDLKTFFLLASPTTVSLLDVRVQQGTSTPWPPSGGDQTVTGVLTVTGNLIVGGNLNGRDVSTLVDGAGTALAYPLWADANTLQNGYLKQSTDMVSISGTGSGPRFNIYTTGILGDANYTRASIYADPNVTEISAQAGGSLASQVTSIRLNSLGTGSQVQFALNGTIKWTFSGTTLIPTATTGVIGTTAAPLAFLRMDAGGGIIFYNSGAAQVELQSDSLNTLSLYDGAGGRTARLEYGATQYLQAGSGTPEASITAGISSLYSRTNGGAGTSLYVKESGTGNTGWAGVVTAGSSPTLTDVTLRHLIGTGTSPTVAVGGATIAGTGATASISGTDSGFIVTLNTGTGTSAAGVMLTVTFATAYGAAPVATVSANNELGAAAFSDGLHSNATTTTLVFTGVGVLTASQTYKWNVTVTGK